MPMSTTAMPLIVAGNIQATSAGEFKGYSSEVMVQIPFEGNFCLPDTNLDY